LRFETVVPPISIAEHIALGHALKAGREALSQIVSLHARPVHPYKAARGRRDPAEKLRQQAVRQAFKAIKELHALKVRMEDELCRVLPRSADPRNLYLFVYLGEPGKLVPCEKSNPADAFDGWRLEEPAFTR
jgi:hypothetical protein